MNSRRTLFLFFIFLFSLCLIGERAYAAKDTNKADVEIGQGYIAEVNGRKISNKAFEKLLQGRSDPQALLDQIISFILLTDKMKKDKSKISPEVDEQLKILKEQQLAQFLYTKEVDSKAELSDEELDKLFPKSDKYKVNFQQIVVRTKQEAEKILEALNKGEDFNNLARQKSIAQNKFKGGQIGYVIPNSGYFEGELSQEDEKAIFKLKDNELSPPIKTREGYSIFKPVSRKELTEQEMDSRKNYLKFKLKKEKVEKLKDTLLSRLRSNANVEIIDKNIKKLEKAEKIDNTYLSLVLAKVNENEITLKDILPPQRAEYGYQLNTPYLKQPNFIKDMLNEKINNVLFIEEGKRLKLSEREEFRQIYDIFRDGLLGQAYAMELIKDLKVTDDELKDYYEKNKERFKDMPERIRVSHILLPDEEQAKEILKKIKAGEDFNKLAEEYSICPTAKKGGDLGYFSRGRMAPLFEETAFKLKKGEVSDVVKTGFGYHIIKKIDQKEQGASSFNDVKYEVEQHVLFQKRDKKIKDLIADLKSKASISINQEALQKYQAKVSSSYPATMAPGTDIPEMPEGQ